MTLALNNPAQPRRRFQNGSLHVVRNAWLLRYYDYELIGRRFVAKRRMVKLGAATLPKDKARKRADKFLRPLNATLPSPGLFPNFDEFLREMYLPIALAKRPRISGKRDEELAGLRKVSLRKLGKIWLLAMSAYIPFLRSWVMRQGARAIPEVGHQEGHTNVRRGLRSAS